MQTFEETQKQEAATWLIENEAERNEKAMREWIRYPLLKKQMGLDQLDTSSMEVWDIGCGAVGGVSSVLHCKKKVRVDPLIPEYQRFFPITGIPKAAENLTDEEWARPNLVIITNALDHFKDPRLALRRMVEATQYGTYFAHFHAINNAITHPHPAHVHNINQEIFDEILSEKFETCWYMDFQHDGLTYAWRKQPAFAGLYRKVIK